MNVKQQTIQKKVSITGVGLHTGKTVSLTILPAPINHGYKFQRIDLDNKPIIEADVDYVVDTSRGTVLEKEGVRVHTTEHILAALVGLQIDNVIIQIDGPEIPILDGSAIKFVEMLEEAGIEEQQSLRNYYEVTEAIHYRNDERNIELAALPLNDYRLTAMVDYNSSILHSQHAQLHAIELFKEQIAPCRTFVFLHELEALFHAGLIKGGNIDNAVVIVDREVTEEEVENLSKLLNKPKIKVGQTGILNDTPLRFPNEPARHKLLDVMGDLALVGRPLKAHILAARPGHTPNVELAKKIKKQMLDSAKSAPQYDPNLPPVYTLTEVAKLLPHRYPFALVDKIVYLDGQTVVGIKNITMNEPQFTGHFPDNPVMPGVLQIEAIAQTGGVLVLTSTGNPESYWPYLVSIDNCRFYHNVVPGDTLIIRCSLLIPMKLGVAKMHGEAWVGKKLVCDVNMTARLVKKAK
ncbi:bifunctional UDP-3-O-[3-hydroxymyristoyl] N-acetylglucosamine deacetylase/3-hydroxyacyl-ACP dehydratase [Emticicia sp. 17c]|uniref:bifunctional UDP-3-O-[3-hydroxymyristoyl] N-acetylglucosamine deacetylase/3-hydroxyacyl-ACP dehydratase n=1 Tax=Emticicia sp. 17c TaxID=3127704 RepID=UPI00301BB260